MISIARSLLVAVALSASASAAFAAASNMPTQYQPDPALKTESIGQLRARVSQAVKEQENAKNLLLSC